MAGRIILFAQCVIGNALSNRFAAGSINQSTFSKRDQQTFYSPRTMRSAVSVAASPKAPQAAIIIIGDEVLKGKTVDTNTPWLAKLLHRQGVDLVRVEVVRDVHEDIVETVQRLKSVVGSEGFIFTSGGIGPTHDDITYEAIASALGRKLEVHAPTLERMKAHFASREPPVEINEGRLRMATLPDKSEVMFSDGLWVPLCNVDGVYILPGIPRLFQALIEGNKDRFIGPQFYSAFLFTKCMEGDLAAPLRQIAQQYASSVAIGSYPKTDPTAGDHNVKITVDGRDKQLVEAAVEAIKNAIKIDAQERSW